MTMTMINFWLTLDHWGISYLSLVLLN